MRFARNLPPLGRRIIGGLNNSSFQSSLRLSSSLSSSQDSQGELEGFTVNFAYNRPKKSTRRLILPHDEYGAAAINLLQDSLPELSYKNMSIFMQDLSWEQVEPLLKKYYDPNIKGNEYLHVEGELQASMTAEIFTLLQEAKRQGVRIYAASANVSAQYSDSLGDRMSICKQRACVTRSLIDYVAADGFVVVPDKSSPLLGRRILTEMLGILVVGRYAGNMSLEAVDVLVAPNATSADIFSVMLQRAGQAPQVREQKRAEFQSSDVESFVRDCEIGRGGGIRGVS